MTSPVLTEIGKRIEPYGTRHHPRRKVNRNHADHRKRAAHIERGDACSRRHRQTFGSSISDR
jgi:hypothetical protein